MKIKTQKKPAKCPQCSGKNIIPIIYGYPSHELFVKETAGKVKLGGCCVSYGIDPATGLPGAIDPQWYCKDCEEEIEE